MCVATPESTERVRAAFPRGSTIDGVKSAKNLLQVVPESLPSAVDARDEDISKPINDALKGRQIDR